MKLYIKKLNIAMRYNSQGEAISVYTHEFPEHTEMHAYSTGVKKGFKRFGLIVDTKYGQYIVFALIENTTGVIETTYEHKALMPMPCGVEYEMV